MRAGYASSMERGCRLRKLFVRVLLPSVAMLAASGVQARVAELRIERLAQAAFTAENLAVQLSWPDAATDGQLVLTAERLTFGDSGIAFRALRWECDATRTGPGTFACDGTLRAKGMPASRLHVVWSDGAVDLRLTQAKIGIDIAGPDATAAWQIEAKSVPAAWLKPLLAGLWPEGRITDGHFDADWRIATAADGALLLGGPLTVANLGIDSSDGRIAAASLDAEGSLDLLLGDKAHRIRGDLTVHGGELLFGGLYASLPETPIALAWTLASGAGSSWSVQDVVWADPESFELRGVASLDTAVEAPLRSADLTFSSPDLSVATPRYFDSLLGGIGLAGLQTAGALQGELRLRDGALDRLDLSLANVDIADASDRFGLDHLDGTLRLKAGNDALDSTLKWRSARVHGIALGAASWALRSSGLGLALTSPVTIPALGGSLTLPRFAWRPSARAGEEASLDLALGLRDIDLRELSRALGWPEFGGALSGDIPSVRYANEVLDLEGGLAMQVFDGSVRIDELTLERPFGVAPTMTGAIAFSNLDLKPLTGAFGFGEITGRLEGFVRDLRLVDWEPVAFDANFQSSTTAKDPRRISQRAVRDLTEVGGGGIAAGLQAQVLKVFQTFGYSRIGLSCKLANDICRMGGLDTGSDGYTIVDGSGLPRVTVIGHQRQVDWPVLVARLKAATEGQALIIE